MSEWKKVKLSEIVDIISGGTPKTKVKEYWNGEIHWLSVKDFKNVERYVYDSEKKVTKLGIEKSSTNYLYRGDTIISARGSVGEIAQIPYKMTFNQSCYGLRTKKYVDCNFFFYLIKNTIPKLKNITHGSVFDTITKDSFVKIEVTIPENILIQKKIAKILSDLDDKIEVNERINKKLEEIAQAIFKHWFIDFEYPVVLDYECEIEEELKSELMKYGYKSFGGLSSPEKGKTFVYVLKKTDETYIAGATDFLLKEYNKQKKENPEIEKFIYWEKLESEEKAKKKAEYLNTEEGITWLKEELKTNPKNQQGKMKQSKLGEILEKWEVKKLYECIDLIIDHRGKTPKKLNGNWENEGILAISAVNIKNRNLINLDKSKFISKELYKKWMREELKEKDIILTSEGPMGELFFLAKKEKYCLSQRLFAIRANNFNLCSEYLYEYLNSFYGKRELNSRTTGTTVLGIRQSQLKKINIIMPVFHIQKYFSDFVLKHYVLKYNNQKENEKLSKIRDTLLPKLMSGELSVENLDINIEEES